MKWEKVREEKNNYGEGDEMRGEGGGRRRNRRSEYWRMLKEKKDVT